MVAARTTPPRPPHAPLDVPRMRPEGPCQGGHSAKREWVGYLSPMTNSTRRLVARPLFVSLSAMGLSGP